jgi:alpha,alpha-trehalase
MRQHESQAGIALRAPPVATPADLFGPIFRTVQERRIFPDSKLFADAIPRRPIETILAGWNAAPLASDTAVRAFVEQHFALPEPAPDTQLWGLPLSEHIEALWPALTRTSEGPGRGSELELPHPYVVPGGRFRELYYWDSYFTMLGLAQSGRQDSVEQMIANFGSLLDRFGLIPNGARSYYRTRSQPPVFYLMAGLSRDLSEAARRRRLGWMRTEHAFWMDGAEDLAPGEAHRRVACLPDGALLNRYWDDACTPRDESWFEDLALARQAVGRDGAELWRDIRAGAESGWDFSSRWLEDGATLATIRTTRILPIDLNCLLSGLERRIAAEAAALGETDLAARFGGFAQQRMRAINTHLWNYELGAYADFDLDRGRVSGQLTAAAAFALFAGVANLSRSARAAIALERLLRPGGLLTTLEATDQQWDAPNGWAPLQWVAVQGLRRLDSGDLAAQIALRWLRTVDAHHRRTGLFLEKYNVETGGAGAGGEYVTPTGFGWTNGVTLSLLAQYGERLPYEAIGPAAPHVNDGP